MYFAGGPEGSRIHNDQAVAKAEINECSGGKLAEMQILENANI